MADYIGSGYITTNETTGQEKTCCRFTSIHDSSRIDGIVSHSTLAPWYSHARPQWEDAVAAWLAKAGRANSLGKVQSTTTIKERPWSLVRRVTFEKGVTYFKACSAAGKHEPALHLFLEEHFNLPIPQSLLVDEGRGWLLTADAGARLEQHLQGPKQLRAFATMLARYAEMQIASLPRITHLLELGLPDRRLRRLPQELETLLADIFPATTQGSPEQPGLHAAALTRRPRLERVCRHLDGSAYASALDHGDLHPGNVLAREDEMRLCDWGDACITHPFCSLMVSLEMCLSEIVADDRPKWKQFLRDAYLEAWTALAPRQDLLADFRRALWLAHLLRALDFAHMLRGAPQEELNRWRPLLFERLEIWVNDVA